MYLRAHLKVNFYCYCLTISLFYLHVCHNNGVLTYQHRHPKPPCIVECLSASSRPRPFSPLHWSQIWILTYPPPVEDIADNAPDSQRSTWTQLCHKYRVHSLYPGHQVSRSWNKQKSIKVEMSFCAWDKEARFGPMTSWIPTAWGTLTNWARDY